MNIYDTPAAITPGTLWLVLAVGLIVSGLVIYVAVRAAILGAHAAIERDKATAAKHVTTRSLTE